MGRKVFISVLGTGFYGICKYQKNDFISEKVRFVQEATLLMLRDKNWNSSSKAYFLTTESALDLNWKTTNNERENQITNKIENYESLHYRLTQLNLPFDCQSINIPDGKNDKEIWEIFNVLFKLIEDNDELYLELTHSFRYLPMLLLVFGNYVKFLKSAKIKHISYGNYEARNKEKNIAPIIDLLPISALQDWTFASANYLENGNVRKLIDLCNNELGPVLRNENTRTEDALILKKFINSLTKVIDERINCRGIGIVTSENLKTLKQTSNKLSNTFIEPLNPVFARIKDSLNAFDENENVQNGFAAVKWCLDFGLYQQAATILIENIVTYICCKHSLNWKVEAERLLVNTAFKVKSEKINKEQWKVSNKEVDAKTRKKMINIVNGLIKSKEIELLYRDFISLSDLRNDFNHAGMRNNPMSANSLKSNLNERFEKVIEIINNNLYLKINSIDIQKKLFINLSNHPSSTWSEIQQKNAIEQFGDIIEIPFPEIEPEWDSERIDNLVEIYLEKILTIAKEKNAHAVVHLMGEYVFCFKLTTLLKENGITVVVSTSKRHSVMNPDGTKTIQFNFVSFRNY